LYSIEFLIQKSCLIRIKPSYYEEEKEISADTEAFGRNDQETDTAVTYEADSKAQEEQADREVEQTIYQLLEEESLDEEDRKLKQLAQELQIDPEEIFGNFLPVLAVKKQLVRSLEIITNERSKNVMLIITGTKGSGKTTLAKDIALFLYKTDRLKSSKVAKIKAEKLNTVDILSKKDTLKDCCMVVEEASDLKRQTIDSLLELSRFLQGSIAFVFEEDKKNINKLFRECPKLMDLLKNRIHLPQYTQEDLTRLAYACLKQKEYRLNPKAEQLLKDKINEIAKQTEPQKQLENINEVMQAAMDHADIRTGKQLSNLATEGRLKDVEILTILPEDLH
jgi:SpoVK/Ycf46/Vps4 family AAA+-type ATPase